MDQRPKAAHRKGLTLLPFILLACNGAKNYTPVSVGNIIAGDVPAGNVEIHGFVQVKGNMLGIFRDYPTAEAMLNKECVAGIATRAQIKELSIYGKTVPVRIRGSIVANPDFISEDKIYGVKVSGRTWYGGFCAARSAIFITMITH